MPGALNFRQLDAGELKACLQQFNSDGYVLIEDMLDLESTSLLSALCNRVYRQTEPHLKTSASASTFHGDDNVRLIYNLHNKHDAFRQLIFNPAVLSMAGALLGDGSYGNAEPFQLSLSQARGLTGPQPPQQLHIDSGLPGTGYTLVLQAAWLLDDFNEENGATRIVPGSHLRRQFAANGISYPDEHIVVARRGSLLLFDGSVWHGSSEKKTDDERWLLVNRYSRWFLRPSFDHTRNTPRALYDTLSDQQRQILGFRFQSPTDEFTRVSRMSDAPEFTVDYTSPLETNSKDR